MDKFKYGRQFVLDNKDFLVNEFLSNPTFRNDNHGLLHYDFFRKEMIFASGIINDVYLNLCTKINESSDVEEKNILSNELIYLYTNIANSMFCKLSRNTIISICDSLISCNNVLEFIEQIDPSMLAIYFIYSDLSLNQSASVKQQLDDSIKNESQRKLMYILDESKNRQQDIKSLLKQIKCINKKIKNAEHLCAKHKKYREKINESCV